MQTIFISTSVPGRARPDYFMALAESFAEDGFKVIVIFDKKPKKLPIHDKISFFSWPNKRPTGIADFRFLRKMIIEYRPNILISSFGSVNMMNVCGFYMKVKNRVNYILSVSEPLFGKPTYLDRVKREFLKIRKIEVYRLATVVVYNSKGTETDSKSYYNLENKDCLLLHNLITSSKIKYKEESERNNELIIIGSLIERKGHTFLLNQFKEVLVDFPNLKLKIIGFGLERAALEEQTETLKILDKVEFIDEIPNNEVSEHFSNALISISSSSHEAFGFINIEAMREGTPIITTRTAGGLEIVEEGKNGYFFDLEDQSSLCKAVKIVLDDWESFSINAKNNFADLYSLEKQIDDHRDLLKSKFK